MEGTRTGVSGCRLFARPTSKSSPRPRPSFVRRSYPLLLCCRELRRWCVYGFISGDRVSGEKVDNKPASVHLIGILVQAFIGEVSVVMPVVPIFCLSSYVVYLYMYYKKKWQRLKAGLLALSRKHAVTHTAISFPPLFFKPTNLHTDVVFFLFCALCAALAGGVVRKAVTKLNIL